MALISPHPIREACFCALLLLAAAVPASAQEPRPADTAAEHDWNDARALELVARAVERRAGARGPTPAADRARAPDPTDPDSVPDADSAPDPDSGLVSYEARAQGYVYFYLDREDAEERTLVKVDQVALELYWRAPDHTKQRIVGLRDAERLPNRMHYHLDHLTVVQDEFGDVIRMGDGDEVRAVPHPAAPGADSIYDYRLVDSLTVRLPGTAEPVRAYRIETRPRSFDRPAIIGSLLIDRATAELVRLTFTFTPASYVDPRLDYIRVSLDNGLWDGRYWLPNEQRVEIRRQVPELDFPVGGVIRAVFRIGEYRLNPPLPEAFFGGAPVVTLPSRIRERYPFDAGLFDDLAGAGLEEPGDLASLRRRAADLAGDRYLSGLPQLRLHLPDASSAIRYNRAEGLFVGAGATYAVGNRARLRAAAGYAFGAGHAPLAAGLRLGDPQRATVTIGVHRHTLHDLGPRPGAAGAVNTLFAALAGEDYLDPYFASGADVQWVRRVDRRWRLRLGLAAERQRSATGGADAALLTAGREFARPIRPVDDGTSIEAVARIARTASGEYAGDWTAALTVLAGRLRPDHDASTDPADDATPTTDRGQPPGAEPGTDDSAPLRYLRPLLDLGARFGTADRRAELRLDASAGLTLGSPPAQRLFLLGGRATIPGYPYRGFAGDRFVLGRIDASHGLLGDWIRLRLRAAAGWTDFRDDHHAPLAWDARPTGGLRASFGGGVGLVHDVLRVDAIRGIHDDGRWRLILSVDPDLWDLL